MQKRIKTFTYEDMKRIDEKETFVKDFFKKEERAHDR